MLSGHAISLHETSEFNDNELLLEDPVAETHDEEAEISSKVLHTASFEELARGHLQCDTVIWVLISLLLVLAWGVGVIMLLYLPVRRYLLRKDISSRKLYVTDSEIVYKATRPSFLPFLGFTKVEKRIPLHLVIGIILEQGCLQTMFGIHTFRIESIAHGKAAPIDELQFQGVSNPRLLRKIIISEAVKCIGEIGSWKRKMHLGEAEHMPTRLRYLSEASTLSRFQSLSGKFDLTAGPEAGKQFPFSPRRSFFDAGGAVPDELLLHKLEEVKQSLQKIESIVGRPETSTEDC